MTYRRREISRILLQALQNMPVVVLTGMRQVGKSTLLQNEPSLRKRRMVSLDDFAQLQAAKRNPEGLLEGDTPITIDEAQKAPELLTVIKRMVDKKRVSGQFLLSGSASFSLLKGISESLAGRALYLALHPFSQREKTRRLDSVPFLMRFFQTLKLPSDHAKAIAPEDVLLGGMPAVCLGQVQDPSVWFKGYEQTYLERDVRELSQVADLLSFRSLLQLATLRSGSILKIAELARDAKLNSTTASRYLNIMEASFVLRRLAPYLRSRASRLIKSPKLYVTDSGMACAIAGIDNLNAKSMEPLRGAMWETYVIQNLAAILESNSLKAHLFFWNVQGRHEVDFIVEIGNEIIAIELKMGTRWNEQDLANLRAFLSTTPHCKAAILAHNGTEAVPLGKKLWAIPAGLLLS